jgi:hypothetical protein
MANKIHALYKHLSSPSVVTLCGLLDSDSLLVTKEKARITCSKCTHLVDRQGKMDLISARAERHIEKSGGESNA